MNPQEIGLAEHFPYKKAIAISGWHSNGPESLAGNRSMYMVLESVNCI